jgi:hypothetical protein
MRQWLRLGTVPPSLFKLITLMTYLFILLTLRLSCLHLCLPALTYPSNHHNPRTCVGLSAYVIKSFFRCAFTLLSHQSYRFVFSTKGFFPLFTFYPTLFTFLTSYSFQPACFAACFAFLCVASAFAGSSWGLPVARWFGLSGGVCALVLPKHAPSEPYLDAIALTFCSEAS